MSNTRKDNLNVKMSMFFASECRWSNNFKRRNYEYLHSLGLREDDLELHYSKWSKEPNKFHHEFVVVPNRRKEKAALKNITKLIDYEDWDAYELPLNKRPQEYYW